MAPRMEGRGWRGEGEDVGFLRGYRWRGAHSYSCPQEGGRVQGWESVFWGGTIMFQDLKDSKIWSSNNTKIPRPSKIIQKYSILFENVFGLVGFRFDRFQDFKDLSRVHHPILLFFQNDRDWRFFGPTKKQFSLLCFWPVPTLTVRTFVGRY